MANKITLADAHNILHGNNYALRAKRLRRHEKAGIVKYPRRANQNTKRLFTPEPVEYKLDVSCKGVYT